MRNRYLVTVATALMVVMLVVQVAGAIVALVSKSMVISHRNRIPRTNFIPGWTT